ncbi:hypothetical protein M758_1G105900 [Ceratodon purpureus]|nr:hypothetical protein M758_1G105900 [Ceratodon purpureus]
MRLQPGKQLVIPADAAGAVGGCHVACSGGRYLAGWMWPGMRLDPGPRAQGKGAVDGQMESSPSGGDIHGLIHPPREGRGPGERGRVQCSAVQCSAVGLGLGLGVGVGGGGVSGGRPWPLAVLPASSVPSPRTFTASAVALARQANTPALRPHSYTHTPSTGRHSKREGIHGASPVIRHKAHIMNAGVSGFKNAIVTKGIVVTCGFVSLVLAARRDGNQCSLSYQKVVQRLELWRLVMAPLVFPSLPELLFGLYLLYFFRVFERQVGSTKYMFFVIFTTAITTFLEIVFLFILKGTESDLSSISNIRLHSGPFGLIFSCFVLFFFDIPASTRVKLLGAEVSEKSFVYFVGLQLLLWSWMQSFIPGLCGVISGLLYRYDVAGIQEIGFLPGAFRQMTWRMAPFFSGISPEMASRMNFSRTTETESRDDDHHEVNLQNRYSRHGWNAERCQCRCIDCTSHRRKGVEASGSGSQSKRRNHSAYPMPE